MNKFTPGPWTASEINTITCEIDPYYIYIEPEIAVIERSTIREDEEPFNARLIAAAPDLLEALEFCIEIEERPEILKLARSAIARAKGEQN